MMKKALTITICFLYTISSLGQKPNSKIGKKEFQTTLIGFIDDRLVVGGEFDYRFPISKRFKLGAGALYGIDIDYDFFDDKKFGYGAIFGDAMFFPDQRQKWGLDAQVGHGIHSRKINYSDKTIPGMYYALSVNYRSIVSKKILLNNAVLIGHRYFHSDYGFFLQYSFFLGVKTGIVF